MAIRNLAQSRFVSGLMMIFLLPFFSISANADLILEISGVPGSNQTTWNFGGSATATGMNQFDNASLTEVDVWNDVGDMWADFYATVTTPSVPSGAFVQVGSNVRSIDELYIDHDTSVNDDEFGIGVDGSSPLTFTTGDLVSWNGSFTLLGADVQNMNPGIYSGNEHGGLALQIRISAVPEPGCTTVLLLGLAPCLYRRRGSLARPESI